MNCLKISNLSKTYPNGVVALDDVSLEIQTGMFGLLGPNGAGKSTLMRILATLQEPDRGTIMFGELDVLDQKHDIRKRLGYLPQEFGLYPSFTAVELLSHFAVLKGITNRGERRDVVTSLLHKTNLFDDRKKRLKTYSGGMKQRFGIAQALLSDPDLIIVDEPTAGLDPAERNRFHNLLCELGENKLVMLSTHIVDDVKELCNDMAILHHGKVLMKDNPLRALDYLDHQVYEKTIDKNDLGSYKEAYVVIAERLAQGRQVIHILSEMDPGDGFSEVRADLNHVYFSQIYGHGHNLTTSSKSFL